MPQLMHQLGWASTADPEWGHAMEAMATLRSCGVDVSEAAVALTPEARDAAVAEVEAACGHKVMRVSGVSGEGVTDLLRAAFNEVQARRAVEGQAPRTDDIDEGRVPEGGWRP
jgi:hypothetical protein